MVASNHVELQIEHHPSGNYTLQRREGDERSFHDYREAGLWAESNPEVFFKAFYIKLQSLMASGVPVTLGRFPDTTTAERAS